MPLAISTVHVLVDDPDAALTFYRDLLGLAVRNEVEHGEFRWITLTPEGQPDIQIVLSNPRAGHSEEDGDILAGLVAKGELGTVNFRSDDLDATFEKLAAAPDAEIVQEPVSQPWGARDVAVRDPAGNLVRIEQA
ncbi:VOC family protein [Nocardia callitridis]|uniref:VOC family protein n=1 Tax=Nocardia callitridis TaxID=648753 RepID=A0ABP9KE91_9NOCA